MYLAITTILSLLGTVHGDKGWGFVGPCPALKGTMHDRGVKLEPKRLSGLWKVIYDQDERTHDMDCFSEKFKKYTTSLNNTQLNETQLQFLIGHQDLAENYFVYDDDAFFTFNDPELSNKAAVQTQQEVDDPFHIKRLSSLDEDIKPLDQEIMDSMKEKDRIHFEENRQYLIDMQKVLRKRIADSSPYDNHWFVLDTDYDNYLMKYTCKEHLGKTNAAGHTREDVFLLKLQNPEETYEEVYVNPQTRHTIQATISTRTMKKSYLTEKKLNSFIAQLKSMVDAGEDYFETFKILEHGEACPKESVDIFLEPGTRRLADVHHDLYLEHVKKHPDEEKHDFMKGEFASMMKMFSKNDLEGGDEDFAHLDLGNLEDLMAAHEDL